MAETGGQDAARLGNSGALASAGAAAGASRGAEGTRASRVPARGRLWPVRHAARVLKQGREEARCAGAAQSRLLSPQPHVSTLF